MEATRESDFLSLLTDSRPQLVIDLRLAPRFDVGALNRRLVFALFQQTDSRYADLSGEMDLRSSKDARLNPSLLAQRVQRYRNPDRSSVSGPIVFLVDESQFDDEFFMSIADAI